MASVRTYYVWRADARKPFRTYRLRRRGPRGRVLPEDHNLLWAGADYRHALAVQRAANGCFRARPGDAPAQPLLFPAWPAELAAAAAGGAAAAGATLGTAAT